MKSLVFFIVDAYCKFNVQNSNMQVNVLVNNIFYNIIHLT